MHAHAYTRLLDGRVRGGEICIVLSTPQSGFGAAVFEAWLLAEDNDCAVDSATAAASVS